MTAHYVIIMLLAITLASIFASVCWLWFVFLPRLADMLRESLELEQSNIDKQSAAIAELKRINERMYEQINQVNLAGGVYR